MREILLGKFKEIFGTNEGVRIYFAPGRVNLIGEHTDYNGGHVFPCALTLGTYAAARKRRDSKGRMFSLNFPEVGIVEFDIKKLEYSAKHDWANYPKGVMWSFDNTGFQMTEGFDILYFGDLPTAAGLSSSASVELVTAVLLKDIYDLDIDMLNMVKYCKEAENVFIGVNCGIMDQFIIGMGKKDNAILLDTNCLKYEYVKMNTGDASVVIANTNKKRGLGDSKYNERRNECAKALSDLQKRLGIISLGEIAEDDFDKNMYLIEDEVCAKRARHAVYENRRTLRAVEALEKNDIETFGRLMNESHISLRVDYEVTGIELDTLVELAWTQRGVIGSRMTGAGFGGCTVSIVKNVYIDEFIRRVGEGYKKAIGHEASFYIAHIGDGARSLD